MKRNYISGAQKRKANNDRKQKACELLKKIPKISNYITATGNTGSSTSGVASFSNTSVLSPRSPSFISEELNADADASSTSSTQQIDNDYDESDTETHDSTLSDHPPFPADAALWPLNTNLTFLQSYWVKAG